MAAAKGCAATSTFTFTSCADPSRPLLLGIVGDGVGSTSSLTKGSSVRDDGLKDLRIPLGDIGDFAWCLLFDLFLSLLCTLVRWCMTGSKR